MNIFYLDRNPAEAARQHCDKHVVKMIIEYAQLLSTAHRLLDGVPGVVVREKPGLMGKISTRRVKVWEMADEATNPLYKASHIKHPGAIWCRSTDRNYSYLYRLFAHLCDEYTHRYGKRHSTDAKLREALSQTPRNILEGPYTDPPQSMAEEFKHEDAVTAYQNYYVGAKARFARWTNRQPPDWFSSRIQDYDQANFSRTRDLAPGAE